MKKSFLRLLLAISLCGLCQCAHREVAIEDDPPLAPKFQPPPLVVATAPDAEAELARRAEVEQEEKSDRIGSFIFDAIVGTVSGAIFGSDEDRREKRWKKSRKRKILVKKGYIDKDQEAPLEGFPSQF